MADAALSRRHDANVSSRYWLTAKGMAATQAHVDAQRSGGWCPTCGRATDPTGWCPTCGEAA